MNASEPYRAQAAVGAIANAGPGRTPEQLQRHAMGAVAMVDPIADLSFAVMNLDARNTEYLTGLVEAASNDELAGLYPTAVVVLRRLVEVIDAGRHAASLVTGD